MTTLPKRGKRREGEGTKKDTKRQRKSGKERRGEERKGERSKISNGNES